MVNSENSPELPADLCEKGLDPHSSDDEELRVLIIAAVVRGAREYTKQAIETNGGNDEL